MSLDGRSSGSRILDHQNATDQCRPPFALGRKQAWNEPYLAAEGGEDFLDIQNACLRLEDQKRTASSVPAEQVHRPPLPKMVERPFDRNGPPLASQDAHNGLNECGVIAIKQLSEL